SAISGRVPAAPGRGVHRVDQRGLRRRPAVHPARLHCASLERCGSAARVGQDSATVTAPAINKQAAWHSCCKITLSNTRPGRTHPPGEVPQRSGHRHGVGPAWFFAWETWIMANTGKGDSRHGSGEHRQEKSTNTGAQAMEKARQAVTSAASKAGQRAEDAA